MSAPQVVSVQPDVGATDVVLSLPITVTFDQVIDTGTVDPSTFSVTYSAPSQVVTAGDLIAGRSPSSTVCVDGSWTFSTNSSNQTVAVFTPTRPLNPNTLFTVTLLGTDAALTSAVIANPGGEAMAVSYQWTFTTGALNLKTRSLRPAGTETPRAHAPETPAASGLPGQHVRLHAPGAWASLDAFSLFCPRCRQPSSALWSGSSPSPPQPKRLARTPQKHPHPTE